MKITRNRLEQILREELAAVAEGRDSEYDYNQGGSGHDPDAPKGRGGVYKEAAEEAEYTPMMPPRESAIAATVGSIINGLRSGKLSAQGAADRLESEVKSTLYKLGLEEGELAERSASAQERCKEKGGYWDLRKGVCYKDADRTKAFNESDLEESWGEPLNKPLRKPDLNKPLRNPDLKTKSGAGGSGKDRPQHQATHTTRRRGYEE